MFNGLMNRLVVLMLLTFALMLTGCGTAAVPVNVEVDRAVDFSKYKTYSWHTNAMTAVGIPVQRAQLAQGYVKAMVEQELSIRGIKPATFVEPDMLVATAIGKVDESKLRAFGDTSFGVTQPVAATLLDQSGKQNGSLVIDFLDAKTGQLLWRGIAHDLVQPVAEMREPVETATRSMMTQFPIMKH